LKEISKTPSHQQRIETTELAAGQSLLLALTHHQMIGTD
jgi:hypothetical protein